MDRDEDLAGLLPDPPPPRPAGREAAIALALRRFDGDDSPATAVPPRRTADSGLRRGWRPLAAAASVLLVALFSVQIALRTPGGPWSDVDRPPPEAARPSDPQYPNPEAEPPPRCTGAECAGARAASPAPAVEPPAKTSGAAAAPSAAVRATPGESPPAPVAPASDFAPPPPPPPPAPAQARSPADAEREAVTVTARRAAGAASKSSASPVTVIAEEALGDEQIVVTGTMHRNAQAVNRRGDWNACTVNDPAQSLEACKAALGTGAKGARGEAASHLSAGLTQAWQQDWRGAIAAFDRAIALQPRLALAYLNRGLAYQQIGDPDRAAADLDRAVRQGRSARAYHNRSVLRRMRGDVRGADADAARAEALDPRYRALAD
ncbi:tetratricopeptide repeat protein [Sphingomonas parva]|uniref:Tetratricopeptide repeat protein n=1 Tax=Sphingomonas parva TaxID=2555898 RepID=A0A4Y8ZW14_9SPHN|nr:tetratricopeptide repeat protein [Sphingomonas parva]TFI60104.1 tetratricopeptide repeat protein [Sphingomonas parva]